MKGKFPGARISHFDSDIIAGTRKANAVKLSGALAGASPVVEAVGDDTNLSVVITPKGTGRVLTKALAPWVAAVATITADLDQTWTAAQVMGGYIRRTLTLTARSDTTPTAALLVAAVPGAVVNTSFDLLVTRTDAAAVNLTVVGGAGVTITGTATVGASNSKLFRVVFTNVTAAAEAVTFYSLGQFGT